MATMTWPLDRSQTLIGFVTSFTTDREVSIGTSDSASDVMATVTVPAGYCRATQLPEWFTSTMTEFETATLYFNGIDDSEPFAAKIV